MARVTGPLMSISASGTYGKTLVYGNWKGRATVRERVIPANPKTPSQVGVRSMMKFVAQAWAALSALAKASWEEAAAARSISAYNAFSSANMNRWQANESPVQASDDAASSTGLTITTQTATGGEGNVTLSITPSAGTNIWGYVIYRDDAEITTPSWPLCIAVIPANGANAVSYVDSPLAPGTYHYRVGAFNVDGKMGTIHADGSATAT